MNYTYKSLETANDLLRNDVKLSATLSERGYLYFKDLLDKSRITRLQDDLRRLLVEERFIEEDPDLPFRWNGKFPEGDEVQATGRVGSRISEFESLARIISDDALLRTLRDLLGGEVFGWAENADRVRIVFKRGAVKDTGGGQKFSDTTPAHQDGYHYPVDFVTVWMPLMDIDSKTGGLILLEDSHRQGVFEHWWNGAEYLGVPDNPEEAASFRERGGAPVAGELKAGDEPKTWLRSEFDVGDVLIFHPWMLHRGLANDSPQLRISADFRYQRTGVPTVWQSGARLFDCFKYLNETRACINELGLEPEMAGRIWEQTRQRGPEPDVSIPKQVEQLVNEFIGA